RRWPPSGPSRPRRWRESSNASREWPPAPTWRAAGWSRTGASSSWTCPRRRSRTAELNHPDTETQRREEKTKRAENSKNRLFFFSVSLCLCGSIFLVGSLPANLPTRPIDHAFLPDDFAETVVLRDLNAVTAMTIAPDGRLFLCEQTGAIRVVKDGKLL